MIHSVISRNDLIKLNEMNNIVPYFIQRNLIFFDTANTILININHTCN